jgi:hypothetical protein
VPKKEDEGVYMDVHVTETSRFSSDGPNLANTPNDGGVP